MPNSKENKELAVSEPEQHWTPAQIELIKSMCVPASATADEFTVLLYMANKFGLDPLARQIYLQKYKKQSEPSGYSPASIMVTFAGFLEIANRDNMLDGISSEALFDELPSGKKLIGARSILWKKGCTHPFTKTVYLEEYIQKDNYNGKPMGLWGSKPVTMICKVSDAQNLRQAFSLGQMYTPEEMPNAEPEAVSSSRQLEDDQMAVFGTPSRPPLDPYTVIKSEQVSVGHLVVEPTPITPEVVAIVAASIPDPAIAERLDRANAIELLTGLKTIYDTRGTWLEITEEQVVDALKKIMGATSIPQAALVMGIGKFGEVIKTNFPDAQGARMKGGPSQQYSALVHFVHDWQERQLAHAEERNKAIEDFAGSVK